MLVIADSRRQGIWYLCFQEFIIALQEQICYALLSLIYTNKFPESYTFEMLLVSLAQFGHPVAHDLLSSDGKYCMFMFVFYCFVQLTFYNCIS